MKIFIRIAISPHYLAHLDCWGATYSVLSSYWLKLICLMCANDKFMSVIMDWNEIPTVTSSWFIYSIFFPLICCPKFLPHNLIIYSVYRHYVELTSYDQNGPKTNMYGCINIQQINKHTCYHISWWPPQGTLLLFAPNKIKIWHRMLYNCTYIHLW